MEAEDIAFSNRRKVTKGFFEYGLWVGDIEKIDGLRLEFDKGGRGKVGRFDLEEISSFKSKGLHHLELGG